MTRYTPQQRDAYLSALSDGPLHHSIARDRAGLSGPVADEILAAGYAAKRLTITDHGPGEHGMVGIKGAR